MFKFGENEATLAWKLWIHFSADNLLTLEFILKKKSLKEISLFLMSLFFYIE